MVKKYKFLIIAIFAVLMLLLVPTISNADVEITRSFPSNDGTIVLNVTGLELSDEKQYEFSLVQKGGTPTDWFLVTDYNETSAKITLSSGTAKIANVLKVAHQGQIFIREKDNTEGYVLERKLVDLDLPIVESIPYTKSGDGYWDYSVYDTIIYGSIGNSMGNRGRSYMVWKKIEDRDIIEAFLDIKTNNKSLRLLESYFQTIPDTGFVQENKLSYKNKNDGLYVLWVHLIGAEGCKDIYSAIIHDGLPEATKVNQYIAGADVTPPTVESIQIVSPKSGNYTAGQEVQIRVFFSEKIVATTAPTLKVKVGEGAAQSLTDGVVKNENNKGYITYTYTIKATDKGQIQVTGLTGGNVQDESENDAVLSSPALTGNITITANLTEEEQGEQPSGEGTDFSKAKFELVKNKNNVVLKISNVTLKDEKNSLMLVVKSNNTKATASEFEAEQIYLSYDKENKVFVSDLLNKYVELKQDVYINILEVSATTGNNVVVSSKKVAKPTEPTYVNAFDSSSMLTSNITLISTLYTHSVENDRKMQIKVGKITDTSILKKIKNNDATGFSDLLTYAKSADALYDEVVDIKNDYSISYKRNKNENGFIDFKQKLKNEEYYFLYVQTKDENGKYISGEAVTLAQASTYYELEDKAWYMFFYGTDDFKWADFGEAAGDNTTADKVLPKTGVDMIAVFTIVVVAAGAIVAGVKYNRFRDIK